MTTAAVQSPPDAAHFVERFADGWAGPHPERLLDLLHPDVRLVQPIFPPTVGRAASRLRQQDRHGARRNDHLGGLTEADPR